MIVSTGRPTSLVCTVVDDCSSAISDAVQQQIFAHATTQQIGLLVLAQEEPSLGSVTCTHLHRIRLGERTAACWSDAGVVRLPTMSPVTPAKSTPSARWTTPKHRTAARNPWMSARKYRRHTGQSLQSATVVRSAGAAPPFCGFVLSYDHIACPNQRRVQQNNSTLLPSCAGGCIDVHGGGPVPAATGAQPDLAGQGLRAAARPGPRA